MKKLIFLAMLIFAAVCNFGCSSDDSTDSDGTTDPFISTTWKYKISSALNVIVFGSDKSVRLLQGSDIDDDWEFDVFSTDVSPYNAALSGTYTVSKNNNGYTATLSQTYSSQSVPIYTFSIESEDSKTGKLDSASSPGIATYPWTFTKK